MMKLPKEDVNVLVKLLLHHIEQELTWDDAYELTYCLKNLMLKITKDSDLLKVKDFKKNKD